MSATRLSPALAQLRFRERQETRRPAPAAETRAPITRRRPGVERVDFERALRIRARFTAGVSPATLAHDEQLRPATIAWVLLGTSSSSTSERAA